MFKLSLLSIASAHLASEPAADSGLPIWFWVLMVLILVVLPILVLWFGPGLQRKDQAVLAARGDVHDLHAEPTETHAEPDDLKKIEGIGPKIASVLNAAGILTFAQLAQTEVSALQAILDEQPTLRLANPGTWPQQAALAAKGNWEGLQELQDRLQAGRES